MWSLIVLGGEIALSEVGSVLSIFSRPIIFSSHLFGWAHPTGFLFQFWTSFSTAVTSLILFNALGRAGLDWLNGDIIFVCWWPDAALQFLALGRDVLAYHGVPVPAGPQWLSAYPRAGSLSHASVFGAVVLLQGFFQRYKHMKVNWRLLEFGMAVPMWRLGQLVTLNGNPWCGRYWFAASAFVALRAVARDLWFSLFDILCSIGTSVARRLRRVFLRIAFAFQLYVQPLCLWLWQWIVRLVPLIFSGTLRRMWNAVAPFGLPSTCLFFVYRLANYLLVDGGAKLDVATGVHALAILYHLGAASLMFFAAVNRDFPAFRKRLSSFLSLKWLATRAWTVLYPVRVACKAIARRVVRPVFRFVWSSLDYLVSHPPVGLAFVLSSNLLLFGVATRTVVGQSVMAWLQAAPSLLDIYRFVGRHAVVPFAGLTLDTAALSPFFSCVCAMSGCFSFNELDNRVHAALERVIVPIRSTAKLWIVPLCVGAALRALRVPDWLASLAVYAYCGAWLTVRWQTDWGLNMRRRRRVPNRRRRDDDGDVDAAAVRAADGVSTVDALPDKIFFDNDCVICLDPLVDDAMSKQVASTNDPVAVRQSVQTLTDVGVRALSCGHCFHRVCLADVVQKNRCPVCRSPLTFSAAALDNLFL